MCIKMLVISDGSRLTLSTEIKVLLLEVMRCHTKGYKISICQISASLKLLYTYLLLVGAK